MNKYCRPGLIEIGIDELHVLQPSRRGVDIKTLKSEFGDKIVFNGAIDSHHTLIEKDADSVKQYN